MEQINEWWPGVWQAVMFVDPWYWAGGGAGLVLVAAIRSVRTRGRRRELRVVAPKLRLDTFQVAPLGRDAFLKFCNDGETATLSAMSIRGGDPVVIRNNYAGHVLDRGGEYRLLLEASGQGRIDKNMLVELTYLDGAGNVYRQVFSTGQPEKAATPRLVRYA